MPRNSKPRVKTIGLPAVLKTSRMGYDGKGQWILLTAEDVAKAKSELPSVKLILERFVPLHSRTLLSSRFVAAPANPPSIRSWKTTNRSGILRLSLAPAQRLDPDIQRAAERAAHRILESLKYSGCARRHRILRAPGGNSLANEMAPPRP